MEKILGYSFSANSLDSGKFTLETKHSPGVSAAGLRFRGPGYRPSSRRQRAKPHSPSSKLGKGAKFASGPLPATAFDPGAGSWALNRGTGYCTCPGALRVPESPPLPSQPPRRDGPTGQASRAQPRAPLTLRSQENPSPSVNSPPAAATTALLHPEPPRTNTSGLRSANRKEVSSPLSADRGPDGTKRRRGCARKVWQRAQVAQF